MSNKEIKIIYIAGLGHSGSTLLDVMLSQHPEIQGVGEVMFYDNWRENEYLCSCGELLKQCRFWREVADNLYTHSFKLDGIVTTRRFNLFPISVEANKYLGYSDRTYDLFCGITRASRKNIIVDSSKIIGRLKLLLADPRFDVNVIHLVRNGFAVVNSLGKEHPRPGTGGKVKTNPTSSPKAALRWVLRNRTISQLAKRGIIPHYLRVRYEDLCKNPKKVIQTICQFIGIDFDRNMINPGTGGIHNIGGSRWRYKNEVKIKLDEHWVNELYFRDRLVFQFIGGWLNHKYGY